MAVSNIHNGWRYDPANSRLDVFYRGTRIADFSDCGITLVTGSGVVSAGGALTVNDDTLFGMGTGQTARLSYDTTDANANAVLLQLPAGGGTDVPVVAVGQSIESVDLGLFNGIVDPKLALFGVGAVATGVTVDFRKARGSVGTPTVITAADDLGSINAYGYSGACGYVQSSRIIFDSVATVANTRVPGTIVFQTGTDAAPTVLTTALTLDEAQLATFAAGLTISAGALTVSAGTANLGAAGSATGVLTLAGATSGVVTHTVNTTAGTYSLEWPADDGCCAEQLTTSGAGVLTWAAASVAEYKNFDPETDVLDGADSLAKALNADVYAFSYKPEIAKLGKHTFGGAPMTGVMAEQAPWAMQGKNKRVFSPINSFGVLLSAFQELSRKVEALAPAPALA